MTTPSPLPCESKMRVTTMAPLLLKIRKGRGYNPSLLGVQQSLARDGKGVAMAHGLPLPEGRMEGDHDLSPCPLEKWRIVASALLKY